MKTMRNNCNQSGKRRGLARGFSLVELVLVMFLMLVIAGFTVPNIMLAVSNWKLRGSASDLAGLMQQARILAAKNNPQPPVAVYSIRYTISPNGAQAAFVDMKGDGVWHNNLVVNGATISEPIIEFGGSTVMAAAAPTGTGGQPTPYVLTGDSSTGLPFNNANTLAWTSRGLPCDNSVPPTCSSPAPSYFVYYLTDTRIGKPGWAAVVVTKGGRTKVVTWNGAIWN